MAVFRFLTGRINDSFRALLKDLIYSVVWKSSVEDNGIVYLKMIKTSDKYARFSDYFFLERVGKDSIAFILKNGYTYGILKQWSTPHKMFFEGAFTGSLDKDTSIETILLGEIKEESGYNVSINNIKEVGSYYSSNSMSNEVVYIYLVDVEGVEPGEKIPENIFEENTEILWVSKSYILKGSDWKAIMAVLSDN